MNLQLQTIHEFQDFYPGVTLKKASEILGIQITRVFRLFNGHEMKLNEYEKFKTVLDKNRDDKDMSFSHLRHKEREEILSQSQTLARWSQYRSF